MASTEAPPPGRRIFIVEDETFVAMLLEDMLADLGFEVAGAASTVEEGLRLASTIEADAAVLDVNVAGVQVFPVAERLAERGVPILFSTGYGRDGVPAPWADRPIVAKPFLREQLEAGLREALGDGRR